MSVDGGSGDSPAVGNGVDAARSPVANQRLRLNPSKEHKPESYDDLQLDFSPSIFSSLEKYLPPTMLSVPRDDKVKFMREILLKYLPHGERNRVSLVIFWKIFLHCLVSENPKENYGKIW